jgi:hypothetical protein
VRVCVCVCREPKRRTSVLAVCPAHVTCRRKILCPSPPPSLVHHCRRRLGGERRRRRRRIVRTCQPRGNGPTLTSRRRDGDDDCERICRAYTFTRYIYYFPGASIPQSRISPKASAYIHKRTWHRMGGNPRSLRGEIFFPMTLSPKELH